MFKNALSLLALVAIVGLSSAATYYTSMPMPMTVEDGGYGGYDGTYTVQKEVTTSYGNSGAPQPSINIVHNYQDGQGQGQGQGQSQNQDASNGNNGRSSGGMSGLVNMAGTMLGGIAQLGMGVAGGAVGTMFGGVDGGTKLANTGANIAKQATSGLSLLG